jgi:hypothetical protein
MSFHKIVHKPSNLHNILNRLWVIHSDPNSITGDSKGMTSDINPSMLNTRLLLKFSNKFLVPSTDPVPNSKHDLHVAPVLRVSNESIVKAFGLVYKVIE